MSSPIGWVEWGGTYFGEGVNQHFHLLCQRLDVFGLGVNFDWWSNNGRLVGDQWLCIALLDNPMMHMNRKNNDDNEIMALM